MGNLKIEQKVFYINRGLIYKGKIISIQERQYTIERMPNKTTLGLMKKRDRIHIRKEEKVYTTIKEDYTAISQDVMDRIKDNYYRVKNNDYQTL